MPFRISPSGTTEHDVLRFVDRAIGRALVEPEFAQELLANPSLAIQGDDGCPIHCAELNSIRASSVQEFAAQALAVFSPSVHRGPDAQVRGAS